MIMMSIERDLWKFDHLSPLIAEVFNLCGNCCAPQTMAKEMFSVVVVIVIYVCNFVFLKKEEQTAIKKTRSKNFLFN